ncbi:hypothetical protein ADT28_02405 [Xylella fastidiosa]|uniref:hypothetical protein n=1 Tax=Xylella fastidiosa TaxID=2371 RepID=UPI0007660C5C|nr:hypothetical protein [Xylella fastidiosa]ALR01470.1 hypothetical protein OY18_03625 [Xylella fastidiosa]KXB13006.1 hypothetical protein ADT29_09015 [Xylella fastidiosa]KXB22479.1 hypothetical protein ADT28_02405 [Xylella fastidiosa]MDG5822503.1 hypothetical protein [Xylella fastidiosa subsp. pauca]MDG5825996.1 hypothetical protein [Xylella fastidiosa subsp. pauca]
MNRYRKAEERSIALRRYYSSRPWLPHCISRDTRATPNALRIANYRVRRAHYEAAKTLSATLIKH